MLPCYHTVSDARRFLEKCGGRGRGRRENLWRVRDPMCRVICFQPVSVFVNSSKEDDLESAWENTIGGKAGRPVGMRMLPSTGTPAFTPTEVFPTPDISTCRIYLIFLPFVTLLHPNFIPNERSRVLCYQAEHWMDHQAEPGTTHIRRRTRNACDACRARKVKVLNVLTYALLMIPDRRYYSAATMDQSAKHV